MDFFLRSTNSAQPTLSFTFGGPSSSSTSFFSIAKQPMEPMSPYATSKKKEKRNLPSQIRTMVIAKSPNVCSGYLVKSGA
jgi:hypothetical protein